EIARVVAELTELVRTTTLRGFAADIPLDALTELLAAPVVAKLTGLSLMYHMTASDWRKESADYYRLVGTSPALRRVQQLFLYSPYTPIHAGELANAKTFDSVRRLSILNITG